MYTVVGCGGLGGVWVGGGWRMVCGVGCVRGVVWWGWGGGVGNMC